MSYCTIAQVQGLNSQRDTYGSTTNPSSTEVEEFITRIGNELDSLMLAWGLTVPITTPTEFVGALSLANAQGAAALAEMAQFPESGAMGGSPHGKELWAQYEKFKAWLKETLKDGKLPASLASGHIGPISFFERNDANETEPEATQTWQKPSIRKNMEF